MSSNNIPHLTKSQPSYSSSFYPNMNNAPLHIESDDDEEENDAAWLLNKKSSIPKKESITNNDKKKEFQDPSWINNNNKKHNNFKSPHMKRIILHLDVDCFYCQCEAIADTTGELSFIPFAIGQKHIVVTSNYAARKLGIQKLMRKSDALRILPNLKIIDGSDLTKYRTQSRKIYIAFRNAVLSLPLTKSHEKCVNESDYKNNVCKGSMDEMFADITASVNYLYQNDYEKNKTDQHLKGDCDVRLTKQSHEPFIYGNQPSTITISEDQSGASSIIAITNQNTPQQETDYIPSNDNNIKFWGNVEERQDCVNRLKIASKLAYMVHKKVYQETQFTTCIGLSVSPMLAKIAADLKKPNSVNLLYPWRSMNILHSMPLRKIPQLGSKTLKSLIPCIKEEKKLLSTFSSNKETENWTCADLLRVPKHKVISCLKNQSLKNCEEQAFILLQRCEGIDSSLIVDDECRVAKTVSVEDSFIRGTITSRLLIYEALEPLFVRLPKLIKERKEDSHMSSLAYPTTIRLTMCNLITKDEKSVLLSKPIRKTISRQQRFKGQELMKFIDLKNHEQMILLRNSIIPLLDSMLDDCKKIGQEMIFNITRINIAVTNFADSKENNTRYNMKTMAFKKDFFQMDKKKDSMKQTPASIIESNINYNENSSNTTQLISNDDEIDPNVLSELPPDIVEEIMQDQHRKRISNRKNHIESSFLTSIELKKNNTKRGIKAYFNVKPSEKKRKTNSLSLPY